jgi:hypothetical protein
MVHKNFSGEVRILLVPKKEVSSNPIKKIKRGD